MNRITNPARSAAPTTEPITIPAIAPSDNLFLELDAVRVELADDVGDEVAELVANVIVAVIDGNTTPAHLVSAPAL